jgi:hypothetical protein
MSQYGAFEGRWAPITAETEDKLPTYGSAISLGALSRCTDSLSFTGLTADGDDRVMDSLNDFASGTVDIEYDAGVENEAIAAVCGHTVGEDGEIVCNAEDAAPYGGYCFLTKNVHGDEKFFQGIFYPKLKAVPQGKAYSGKKTSGTTLTGDKIHANLEAALNGQYKIVSKEFKTIAEARAWLDQKLPKAAT